MTRPSLGITAMELFVCNPFRVLGIAVDTPTADVTLTYKKLLDMAAKGDTADYETPYDFDFLPPFSRSEKDLKTLMTLCSTSEISHAMTVSSDVICGSSPMTEILKSLNFGYHFVST